MNQGNSRKQAYSDTIREVEGEVEDGTSPGVWGRQVSHWINFVCAQAFSVVFANAGDRFAKSACQNQDTMLPNETALEVLVPLRRTAELLSPERGRRFHC